MIDDIFTFLILGELEILLIWKFLTRNSPDQTGVSSSEFGKIFKAVGLNWSIVPKDSKNEENLWYKGKCTFFISLVSNLYLLVLSRGFEYVVYGVVGTNTVLIVIQAGLVEKIDQDHAMFNPIVGLIFVVLYLMELIMKMLGLGVREYFKCPWNVLDFIVTMTGMSNVFLVFGHNDKHISTVVILR